MARPGGPGSRREHQAAASRWVEQPSRETEHRGPRHGTRSQAPALRTPPPSPAAHAASGHCQKPPEPPRRGKQGGLCTQDPGPRVSPPELGAAAWLPLPGCRAARVGGTSREGSVARGHGRARTPARRGAEPGAGIRSSSLPGAPKSGRLLRLQPRGRRLPPPKLPGASWPLRAAPDAGSELAHQVRMAAEFLRLQLGRACF